MIRVNSTPNIEKWRETAELSPLEVLIALWEEGFVVEAEALQSAEYGTMPPAISYAISALDPTSQTLARMAWAKASAIQRLHPIVLLLAEAFTVTPEEIDRMFKTYRGRGASINA